MNHDERLLEILSTLDDLPRFEDGRINYTTSKVCPVLNIFVRYDSKVLLLKRSDKVSTYQGYWQVVAGYLDEPVPIKQKILEEMREEVQIEEDLIENIKFGNIFEENDLEIHWIIFTALVDLKEKPDIKLDWEHTEYLWVKPEDFSKHEIIPGVDKIVNSLVY